jgi:hypothetical protein
MQQTHGVPAPRIRPMPASQRTEKENSMSIEPGIEQFMAAARAYLFGFIAQQPAPAADCRTH